MSGLAGNAIEALLAGMLAMAGVSYTSHAEAALVQNEPAHVQTEAMRVRLGSGENRTEVVFMARQGKVAPARREVARRMIWRLSESEIRLPR